MKHRYIAAFYALALVAIAMGCKNQKLAKGETEIEVPCSGKEFFSDKSTFRANSVGESQDQVTSKKKALANARNDLAQSIQTTVKTVTDNYVNSREMTNREGIEERFESLNREVVNQTLVSVRTICEKLVRTNKGSYKTYVAIELLAKDLVEQYNERISKDESLRIDYDYEKFKKTFEEEMEKQGG